MHTVRGPVTARTDEEHCHCLHVRHTHIEHIISKLAWVTEWEELAVDLLEL